MSRTAVTLARTALTSSLLDTTSTASSTLLNVTSLFSASLALAAQTYSSKLINTDLG